MAKKGQFPCDYNKACHVLWAVLVKRWTMTEAAIECRLNVGTVSHVCHGERFPSAYPVPLPGFE